MIDSPWASPEEASQELGVDQSTLDMWREIGYLKPGTHWRTSPDSLRKPWQPEVIYHLRWCKEEMNYWRSKNAIIIHNINDIAA
tara:strand:+ start:292 stop:543 length:252 start_codon:yes stop_codon:yes gene_type:complete